MNLDTSIRTELVPATLRDNVYLVSSCSSLIPLIAIPSVLSGSSSKPIVASALTLDPLTAVSVVVSRTAPSGYFTVKSSVLTVVSVFTTLESADSTGITFDAVVSGTDTAYEPTDTSPFTSALVKFPLTVYVNPFDTV